MSKNIAIQEGGIDKQLTVDKLETNLVGGGACLWVPEDEVQLTTKHITQNGTYKASNDGYYGYSEVTVSGIGYATGTDGDGDEVVAYTDPGTGVLVTDKVPSRIEVVTPPTNPYGIYVDGQTIITDGMVVKAYLESGDEYGIVPNNEITIEPTVADYSKTSGVGASEYTAFGQGPWPQPVNYVSGSLIIQMRNTDDHFQIDNGGGYISILAYNNNYNNFIVLVCASSPGTATIGWQFDEHGEPYQRITVNVTSAYTYDGKTVYYASHAFAYKVEPSAGMNLQVNGTTLDRERAAWIILYGEKVTTPNVQTINVSWPRPLDGKVLETSFEILVAPGYTPNGGE